MRILIVGGGPGGLYLAQLLKRADPQHDVIMLERNRADDTFGFGVVFSDGTLQTLAVDDARTVQALEEASFRWDAIEVRHAGELVRAQGNSFIALRRAKLLGVLQRLALDAGADVRFEQDVSALPDLEAYDLVVAADGANSLLRAHFADVLAPALAPLGTRYIWFGTTKRFDSMTFIFEESEHGWFGAHAYPIDAQTSTFLIEADEQTWRNAGFDQIDESTMAPGDNDEVTLAYVERLFSDHLDGGRIIGNNSRWRQFNTLTCRSWHAGHVVLLGDAVHTAHFSVGSGTKMAMEDAVALAGALRDASSVAEAIDAYERARMPLVERVQRAGKPSQAWWEGMSAAMDREPLDLMAHFMTRTPRVSIENLRVRDPALVRQIERGWRDAHPEADGASPLGTPIDVGELALPNRLVVPVHGYDYERAIAPALSGAGLVLLDCAAGAGQWREAIAYLQEKTPAKAGARIPGESDGALLTVAVQEAAGAGFDLVELAFAEINEASIRESVEAVKDTWSGPIAVQLPLLVVDDAYVDACRTAYDAGADLVNIVAGSPAQESWHLLRASERARAEVGVATMIEGGFAGADAADTAIITGRVDLCADQPSLTSRRWGT